MDPALEDELYEQDPPRRPEAESLALFESAETCKACAAYKAEGLNIYPPHNPSPRCQSGGYAHCTCDTCF